MHTDMDMIIILTSKKMSGKISKEVPNFEIPK